MKLKAKASFPKCLAISNQFFGSTPLHYLNHLTTDALNYKVFNLWKTTINAEYRKGNTYYLQKLEYTSLSHSNQFVVVSRLSRPSFVKFFFSKIKNLRKN